MDNVKQSIKLILQKTPHYLEKYKVLIIGIPVLLMFGYLSLQVTKIVSPPVSEAEKTERLDAAKRTTLDLDTDPAILELQNRLKDGSSGESPDPGQGNPFR